MAAVFIGKCRAILRGPRACIARFWIDPLDRLLQEMICLPPSSPWRPVRRAAEWARDLGRLAYAGPRVTVRVWEGLEWALVYVDQESHASETELRHVFFSDASPRSSATRIWIWQAPRLVRVHAAQGRLIVLGLNPLLRWRLPGVWQVRTFPWLRSVLDVSVSMDTIVGGLTRRRRQELTRVGKLGFEYGVSRDPAEFEHFHLRMHVPFVTGRYQDRARVRPFEEQLRVFVKRGELLWVKREGSLVAATLGTLRRFGRTFCAIQLGIDQEQDPLVKRDVITAMYWHIVKWSRDRGFRFVDLGRAPGRLNDGLFLYKHRWGVRFERDRTSGIMWTFAGRDLPAELVCRLNEAGFVAEAGHEYRCAVFRGQPESCLSAEEVARRNKVVSQAGLDGLLDVNVGETRRVQSE